MYDTTNLGDYKRRWVAGFHLAFYLPIYVLPTYISYPLFQLSGYSHGKSISECDLLMSILNQIHYTYLSVLLGSLCRFGLMLKQSLLSCIGIECGPFRDSYRVRKQDCK